MCVCERVSSCSSPFHPFSSWALKSFAKLVCLKTIQFWCALKHNCKINFISINPLLDSNLNTLTHSISSYWWFSMPKTRKSWLKSQAACYTTHSWQAYHKTHQKTFLLSWCRLDFLKLNANVSLRHTVIRIFDIVFSTFVWLMKGFDHAGFVVICFTFLRRFLNFNFDFWCK